jgi:signal transduction histidine kinase
MRLAPVPGGSSSLPLTQEVLLGSESPRGVPARGVPSAVEVGAGLEIARAVARLRDLDSVGRTAVAAAVHLEGGGMRRAWLLEWEARTGVLEGCHWAVAPADGVPLSGWLEARGVRRAGTEARGFTLRPAELRGAAAAAWDGVARGEEAGASPEVPWGDGAHVGAVALRRGSVPWALLVGTWATPPEPERRRLLEGIGLLASVAAQGLEREQEAARRAAQAAALGQALHAVGATLNLTEVLRLAAKLAVQATGARGGALWTLAGTGLDLQVTQGPPARRERMGRALAGLAAAVVEDGRLRVVDRPADELLVAPDAAASLESLVVCPLRAYGRVLGALACYDRVPPRRSDAPGFAAADAEFVSALGDFAGLAVDQAGRFAEQRAGEQQRRELAGRLRRLERLAHVGEIAARMSEEARNPLASIGAFARRAQRALAEDDPARDYLEVVLRESARLESLLAEQAGYAGPESALRLEDLNAVVLEALSAAAGELSARRVRLVKRLAPGLPALLLDRERIRRVVGNVLEGALDAVSAGGRVRIESRQAGAAVLLEVAHDGPHGPGDLLEQLFVPFASQRPGGPAVGLGVAQQIVREHGGEIRVRSDGEWGPVFALSLPVRGNQDRRQGGTDRRRARADRRVPDAPGRAG